MDLKHNVDALIFEWDHLLSGMELRKQALSGIMNLQKSIDDIEETISWIVDIEVTTCSEHFGKDLNSVQLLLREHEMVENTRLAIKVSCCFIYFIHF